jgi:rRNA-processing protein FCF1
MPPAPGSPFVGIDRLVVDGTNMLYRMGSRSAAPPAAIVGRLRAVIPPTISIDLLFDGIGHGVKGRVAQHMYVRYSGRHTADEAILGLTAAIGEAAGGSPEAYERMLVVTNDRDLRERLEARGVRTRPTQWLLNRLDMPRLASPAPGNRRPTIGSGHTTATPNPFAPDESDRKGWKPGRGATTKTGTAHKVARHKRHPKHNG